LTAEVVDVAAMAGVTWNWPQVDALPHTDQSTPALVGSLLTTAVRLIGLDVTTPFNWLLTCICDGAYGMKLTPITGTTVTFADTERVGKAVFDAVEVAVMVTLPAGAVTGAVNAVAALLAVWAGLNVPQGEFAQLTVQSTPAAATSLVTVAVKFTGVPAVAEVSGAGVKAMEIAGTTVTTADWFLVLSEVEVAVTVTAPPAGTAPGAV
jgi:hypothetical protein